MRVIVAAVLSALCLASCVSPPKTATDVFERTTVSVDAYSKTEWTRGPSFELIGSYGYCFLRSSNTQGRRNYQLYAIHKGNNWAFLRSAIDSDSRRFSIHEIDSEVGYGGSITEHVAIDLDRSYLEAAARSDGLDFRINGQRYSVIAKMPAFAVQGFLARIDGRAPIEPNTP